MLKTDKHKEEFVLYTVMFNKDAHIEQLEKCIEQLEVHIEQLQRENKELKGNYSSHARSTGQKQQEQQ